MEVWFLRFEHVFVSCSPEGLIYLLAGGLWVWVPAVLRVQGKYFSSCWAEIKLFWGDL